MVPRDPHRPPLQARTGAHDRLGAAPPPGRVRAQGVVHDHAVAARLEPDLTAADEVAGDAPADALVAAVHEHDKLEAGPRPAYNSGIPERGGERRRLDDDEARVHEIDKRHPTSLPSRGSVPDRVPEGAAG